MLKFRLPSAIVLISLLSLGIWGIYRPCFNLVLPALALLFSFLATREMLILEASSRPFGKWAQFCNALLIAAASACLLNPECNRLKSVLGFAFLLAFCGTLLLPVALSSIEGAMASIGATFLCLLYVTIPMAFLLAIAFYGLGKGALDARFYLVWGVAVVKSADIGAYAVGSLFGRSRLGNHKFVPKISPGKSIEGVIGGIAFSLAAGLCCARWLPGLWDVFLKLGSHIAPEVRTGAVIGVIILSLILSLLGILGDLVESVFKRDAKIKDSGSYIPGMGGALDVLDSLLLTAPFLYAALRIIGRF